MSQFQQHPDQQYRGRSPQQLKANKKRQRQLDWEDTRRPGWVAWLSGICLIAMGCGVIAMGASDLTSKAPNINGDQLGPFEGTPAQYREHAREQLDHMTGEEPRWALVSPAPEHAWNSSEVIELLKGIDARVSTLYFGATAYATLPEPAVGHTRADVINRAVGRMARSAHTQPDKLRIDGVLVHATPEQLRELAKRAYAVEPADPGAVYGRIGIRPMGAR
ncbi:hypothetical protein ACN4D9_05610 [Corynebacterium macclintockiae]|uniref:hypothetical protein n=1 Tax=Corynebacterium macclintockiae TaxID=2913501 RepID=UPI002551B240|nr:hypothetical protein [Corynebacterium macclintockiae]MDK8889925.1 hypothetical protein [Corynebacterium macclintockiae]